MTDEDDRINQRFERVRHPKESTIVAVFDADNGTWLVKATSLSDDDGFCNAVRQVADGASLREALMNLADKINV